MARIGIEAVNLMSDEQFEWAFSNVIELCSDAAVQVKKSKPFRSVAELCEAFWQYLDTLSEKEKVVILQLHPDLAGKVAVEGQLTKESTNEQKSAGLHQLTHEQKSIIDTNNERYKNKFGFPFIICVRENKIQAIMEGLRKRFNNSREQEMNIAIGEVKKIIKLRLLDIVEEN